MVAQTDLDHADTDDHQPIFMSFNEGLVSPKSDTHAHSFRGLHKLEPKHKAPITGCCFSGADSEERVTVCTISWDGHASLYDATTGTFLRDLKHVHITGILCCTFFRENTSGREYLCLGGVDKSISLYRQLDTLDGHVFSNCWKLGLLDVVQLMDIHAEGVTCCCVSDERLCLGSWDRTASIIKVESLAKIFEVARDMNNTAAPRPELEPEPEQPASWRTVSFEKLEEKCPSWRSAHIKYHKDAILCCCFGEKGEKLCLGSQDKTATVWNVQDVELSEWLEGSGGLHVHGQCTRTLRDDSFRMHTILAVIVCRRE